jgi:hypothetical protein
MCGEKIEPPGRLISLKNVMPIGQAGHNFGGFTPNGSA